MWNLWLFSGLLSGGSHMAMVRAPKLWLASVSTALLAGGALAPRTTSASLFILMFTAMLPEIALLHVGYYGVRGLLAAGAYWALAALTGRRDPELKSAEKSWIRRSRFWQHLAEYFPSTLIKEASYDEGLHLFVAHPHGLWCCGAWTNLIPEREGHGLPKRRVATIDSNFYVPVLRDLLFSMGLIGSSAKSIRRSLAAGFNVVLFSGGGKEALLTKPGTMDLVLNRRKGFVKLALQNGASLVPVLTFGETSLYEPAGASWLWDPMNRLLLRVGGISMPMLQGYWGTFLPQVRPITTVAGPPVPVKKEAEPSAELISETHARYCAALRSLYDRHKDNFDKERTSEMRFVD